MSSPRPSSQYKYPNYPKHSSLQNKSAPHQQQESQKIETKEDDKSKYFEAEKTCTAPQDIEMLPRGQRYYQNGIYEGGWNDKKNMPEGEGTLTIRRRDRFHGDLCNMKYKGIWDNKGSVTLNNGSQSLTYRGKLSGEEFFDPWYYRGFYFYAGDMENGKRDGHGRDTTSIWETSGLPLYEGPWKNGVRHGNGKLTFRNGSTCTGTWEDGVAHGTMVFYDSFTQETREQEWNKGKFVSSKVISSK